MRTRLQHAAQRGATKNAMNANVGSESDPLRLSSSAQLRLGAAPVVENCAGPCHSFPAHAQVSMHTFRKVLASVACASFAAACSEPSGIAFDGGGDAPSPSGLPVLGAGTHDPANIEVSVILSAEDRLAGPRDLAFRPGADHELWVANGADSSMVVVSNAGSPEQVAVRQRTAGADHFMPQPSALAFGTSTFATVHEISVATQADTPADFMGPTLWPADPELFRAGHSSHLDMLHNSPDSVGVEWEEGNAFWVFDGAHASLTRYDFRADHGPGAEDHSDGVIARYAEGEVSYVPNVGSHLVLDHVTGLLYVADTGNQRIAVLDIHTGTRGGTLRPNYDGASMSMMNGASLTTLVDAAAFGIAQPSGIALANDILYVTDHASASIHAFSLQGERLDWIDLSSVAEPDALSGIAVDVEGRLYVADTLGERVIRLAAIAR